MLRGLLVLDHEHVEEAVADEASERRERRKRPDDLEDNGHRDGDAEEKHHHAPPADEVPAAHGLRGRKGRHQDVVGDWKRNEGVAHGANDIFAVLVKIEDAAIECVYRQQHDVDGQNRIPGPDERTGLPLSQIEVCDDETTPHHDEHDEGQEEEDGVEVPQARPAKPGKHAPRRVRHVVKENAQQEAAVAHDARGAHALPATDEQPVVDDKVN